MSRLTSYNKPSILNRIANAPNLESLSLFREIIALGMQCGKIDADDKTARKWAQALWQRVDTFMRRAATADELCFIFNTTMTWSKDSETETMLKRTFEFKSKLL